MPGKGYSVMLRLYSPLEPFFSKHGDRAKSSCEVDRAASLNEKEHAMKRIHVAVLSLVFAAALQTGTAQEIRNRF